jgi:predicted MFS family arabinose efflux permease
MPRHVSGKKSSRGTKKVPAAIARNQNIGIYMGFTSLGNILAPSIGPILGGVLSKYLGWEAILQMARFHPTAGVDPFPTMPRHVSGKKSSRGTKNQEARECP